MYFLLRFKFAIEKIIQNIVPLNVEKSAPLGSKGIRKINRYIVGAKTKILFDELKSIKFFFKKINII